MKVCTLESSNEMYQWLEGIFHALKSALHTLHTVFNNKYLNLCHQKIMFSSSVIASVLDLRQNRSFPRSVRWQIATICSHKLYWNIKIQVLKFTWLSHCYQIKLAILMIWTGSLIRSGPLTWKIWNFQWLPINLVNFS